MSSPLRLSFRAFASADPRIPWVAAYALAAGSCFALTFATVCPAHAAGPPTLPSADSAPAETMTDPVPPTSGEPGQGPSNRAPAATSAPTPATTPAPTTSATSSAGAVGNRAHSVEALSRRLEAWVSDPDPAANANAVERVARGVPPGAMVAFLVAVSEHPRPAFESAVETATRYRKVAVRGHALAAWAAFGPTQAAQAIERAVDDREQGIRRLAVVLEQAHASPTSEALVARMLERDATLAAENAAPVHLVPDEPLPPPASDATPSAQGDDDEVIVIDDEAPPVEDELIVIDEDDEDGAEDGAEDGLKS